MPQTGEQMELEEKYFPTSAALVQRWLPWIRLLRGFRIAIDARRMMIAFLAVFLWSAGEWLITQQTFAPFRIEDDRPRMLWPWQQSEVLNVQLRGSVDPTGSLPVLTSTDIWIRPVQEITWPMLKVVTPLAQLISGRANPKPIIYLWSLFAWAALITVIFGGAISRMAAVDFARGEEISIRGALGYSTRRWKSYLGAPLIAGTAFAACWGFNFLMGLIASSTGIGEILVAIAWFLPMLAGFVMVLFLIGVGLGWPLMIASVSTESADAFDGFSRAYSYVLNRPWYLLFLVLCTLIYGSLLLKFVSGVVTLTHEMTQISVSSGQLGEESLVRGSPRTLSFTPLNQLTDGLSKQVEVEGTANSVKQFWLRALMSIPTAFTFSFFWTMVTIIYFLLRKREDATPINEVWLATSNVGSGPPVAGIPAADLRETKHEKTTTSPEEPPAQLPEQ